MRVFVFLLVLANLLFFVWAHGYLETAETGAFQADDQLRANQIRIVSNDQPPELAPSPLPDPSSPPAVASLPPVEPASAEPPAPPTEPPREEICVALNNVSPAEANSLEGLLAEKLPRFRLSRRGAPVTPNNYWVHIPPLRTRRDAENKVLELRNLGVREYFITPEGDGFAVSLGLFSTQGAAESSLATLREQGVRSARIVERPRRPTPSQIELLGPRPQAGELRQLLGQALPQARQGACGRNTAQ